MLLPSTLTLFERSTLACSLRDGHCFPPFQINFLNHTSPVGVASLGSRVDDIGSDCINWTTRVDDIGSDCINRTSRVDDIGSDCVNRTSRADDSGSDYFNRTSRVDDSGSDCINRTTRADDSGSDYINRTWEYKKGRQAGARSSGTTESRRVALSEKINNQQSKKF